MAKSYTNEFKEKVISLFLSGRKQTDLMRDFNLSKDTLQRWRKEYSLNGKFGLNKKLNVSDKDFNDLKKEFKKLQLEFEVLKRAFQMDGVKKK